MTSETCPVWAQDCHDCGQSIPGGTYRQYVDDTSLLVRHINGCPQRGLIGIPANERN